MPSDHVTYVILQFFNQSLCTAQYVTSPIASVYAKCVDEVRGIYKKGGFSITEIHCDNEFHKAMDLYVINQEPPIHMNYASAQEH
eukprot:1272841-Ditylum_brightwellii.AAC.1